MQKYYELKSKKGILRGYIHIPNKEYYPLCIIFHGFTGIHTGTKFSYTTLSRMLEKQGIASLRLDFLGTGDSDLEFKDMTFEDELNSAIEILKTMKQHPQITDIYLLGHSMGGIIASELAKLYPSSISKMCLWAPAFNLPQAIHYLKGDSKEAKYYDHNGFVISNEFIKDIIKRDFYKQLDIYQNELMIIHGTNDKTVPFEISYEYLRKFHDAEFHPIKDASHNYDHMSHINEVINLTYQFFIK